MRIKILLTFCVIGIGVATSFYLNMTMPDKADDMAMQQSNMVDPSTGKSSEMTSQSEATNLRLYEKIVYYADAIISIICLLLLLTIWKADLLALKKPKAEIISASSQSKTNGLRWY